VTVDGAYPFGPGLGYSAFEWTDAAVESPVIGTDGVARLSLTVRNAGDRPGADVVQVYLSDPVASVVLPVQRLIGFRKVALAPGESVRLTVEVPADLASFTGQSGSRIVEPGGLVIGFGRSSGDIPVTLEVALDGPVRTLGFDRALHPTWTVSPTGSGRADA
jgi:beta-xylosidase